MVSAIFNKCIQHNLIEVQNNAALNNEKFYFPETGDIFRNMTNHFKRHVNLVQNDNLYDSKSNEEFYSFSWK